jgi:DNA replication protein DnaC
MWRRISADAEMHRITTGMVVMRMLTEEHFKCLASRLRVKTFAALLQEMCEDEIGTYIGKTFEERMAILIEAEVDSRDSKRIAKMHKQARFSEPDACIEDIIYLPERSLDKDYMNRLAACRYIKEHNHLIVISESGCGKSYLVQALGNAACRNLHSVRYIRHADLCKEINIARNSGSPKYYEAMKKFGDVKLLIIDDFFTTPISEANTFDTFEIIESRVNSGSLIIASIIDPEQWHLRIPTKTTADSLVERIVRRSKYIDLRGPNMRKYIAEQNGLVFVD